MLRLPEGESVDFRAVATCSSRPPHAVKFSEFDVEEEYRGDWERFGFFNLESGCKDTTIRAYHGQLPRRERGGEVQYPCCHAATRSEGIPPGIMSSWTFNLKPGDR